jgi:hypothetical protein
MRQGDDKCGQSVDRCDMRYATSRDFQKGGDVLKKMLLDSLVQKHNHGQGGKLGGYYCHKKMGSYFKKVCAGAIYEPNIPLNRISI